MLTGRGQTDVQSLGPVQTHLTARAAAGDQLRVRGGVVEQVDQHAPKGARRNGDGAFPPHEAFPAPCLGGQVFGPADGDRLNIGTRGSWHMPHLAQRTRLLDHGQKQRRP